MFHDELELLEIRLHELDDVVDRFLIVESTVTFRGKSKDLVFSQARDRFSSFLGRIDHLVVDDMPADGDAWARESHQRNATANGLAELGSEDIVIISDAHEIPARDAVARLCDVALPAGFIQPVHYGWLDFRAKTPNSHKNWVGTRAMWAGSFTPRIYAISEPTFRRSSNQGDGTSAMWAARVEWRQNWQRIHTKRTTARRSRWSFMTHFEVAKIRSGERTSHMNGLLCHWITTRPTSSRTNSDSKTCCWVDGFPVKASRVPKRASAR